MIFQYIKQHKQSCRWFFTFYCSQFCYVFTCILLIFWGRKHICTSPKWCRWQKQGTASRLICLTLLLATAGTVWQRLHKHWISQPWRRRHCAPSEDTLPIPDMEQTDCWGVLLPGSMGRKQFKRSPSVLQKVLPQIKHASCGLSPH